MHKLFENLKSVTMVTGEDNIKERMTLSCSKNFNHAIINVLATSARLNRTPTELTFSAKDISLHHSRVKLATLELLEN